MSLNVLYTLILTKYFEVVTTRYVAIFEVLDTWLSQSYHKVSKNRQRWRYYWLLYMRYQLSYIRAYCNI